MRRARLWIWGAVAVLVAGSLWAAQARAGRMQRAEAALHEAQRLYECGKIAEAATLLADLLARQPRCAAGHALLGELYAAQGRELLALEHYRTVADLQPREAQAYYDLTASCVVTGRYDIAEEYLARHLREQPEDAHGRRLLRFVRRERTQRARADLLPLGG